MAETHKYTHKTAMEARANEVIAAREYYPMPESGDVWMCQVCEDLLGVGDTVTDIFTCDKCTRAIEAERVWVAHWKN